MKLPQVHIAVNVGGLLTALGSAGAFAVANPGCVTGALPAKDTLAVTAALGALAAFLPTKRGDASAAPTKSGPGATGAG